MPNLNNMVRGDLTEEVAFNQGSEELGAVLSGAGKILEIFTNELLTFFSTGSTIGCFSHTSVPRCLGLEKNIEVMLSSSALL